MCALLRLSSMTQLPQLLQIFQETALRGPGKMNLVWIKEEQFLFLPNMSAAHFPSWQHICFQQGFFTVAQNKKE